MTFSGVHATIRSTVLRATPRRSSFVGHRFRRIASTMRCWATCMYWCGDIITMRCFLSLKSIDIEYGFLVLGSRPCFTGLLVLGSWCSDLARPDSTQNSQDTSRRFQTALDTLFLEVSSSFCVVFSVPSEVKLMSFVYSKQPEKNLGSIEKIKSRCLGCHKCHNSVLKCLITMS